MPIDYSKWDHLEVSDDSDVEVHPNVDKKSFVRMKQRQIHEERMKRDNDIKLMRQQNEMYVHLNKRVDKMLMTLKDDALFEEKQRNDFLAENFDPKETSDTAEDLPTYNEMIEDLFTQIFEDKKPQNGAEVRKYVVEHRAKINAVTKQNNERLEKLYAEKAKHITSEDIHTGFDSFYTNKDDVKKESVAEKGKTKRTVIETINDPKSVPAKSEEKKPETKKKAQPTPEEELENLKTYPETDAFGLISMKDYTASAKYLRTHPFIVNEQQKDGLLMKAFDYQLKNDSKTAKNIIHQSLCIRFVADLVKDSKDYAQVERAVLLFFDKVMQDNALLMQETENTFDHIKKRCEVIKSESSNEQEEQIQLKLLDPNSKLTVTIPQEGTPEYSEFLKLLANMQAAVKTGDLDKINEVLGKLPVAEAEGVLEIFEKSGVIGIQAVLENEEEWNKMQSMLGVELRSTDPNAELIVLKPDESNEEAYAEFLKLPKSMQEACKSESIDKVNEVFATEITAEEAEKVLGLLEGAGVLALRRTGQ